MEDSFSQLQYLWPKLLMPSSVSWSSVSSANTSPSTSFSRTSCLYKIYLVTNHVIYAVSNNRTKRKPVRVHFVPEFAPACLKKVQNILDGPIRL